MVHRVRAGPCMMSAVDHSGGARAGAEEHPEPDTVSLQPARARSFAADAFARLAIELHDARGTDQTVEAVAQFAVRAANCAYAGVVLAVRSGRAQIAAVTDPLIETMYRLQIDTGAGPMLAALSGAATISVPDVTLEARWPIRHQVAGLDVCSELHVPMRAGHKTVGVLSLFNHVPHAFTTDDEAIAHILARHASVAISSARNKESLVQAVAARELVGQAMGILMERFDLDADRAFAILKRYSQDNNRKLRDVAQELIDTRRLPGNLHQPDGVE